MGKLLRGRSRIAEQEEVLEEILRIASDSQVDCLLVCGDLYDSHAPSPDAERLVLNFFAQVAGRRLPTVVIGGNHDHPKRLAALQQLLERLLIYVRPEPVRPDQGGVIELETGDEKARLAVLPFVSERKIVDASKLMEPAEEWSQDYAERAAQMCGLLAESFQSDTVNLLLAHIHVHDAQTSGSERAIHVAHPYAVDSQNFPASAQYVALGHLHRPQDVPAPCPAAYCGSTLQLDFGEQLQEKRVVIVEAHPGRPAHLTSVGLSAGRRLRSVEGTIKELEEQSGSFGDDFLRVTVEVEQPVPGIADQVREILPNALDVRIDYPRSETMAPRQSLSALSPVDIFAEYYQRQHGASPPESVAQLFGRLYEEALDASD